MADEALPRIIHQRTRLRILSYLMRNRQASFTTVRDELDLTGGTLSKHADRLEEAGYVEKARVLTSSGFETRYRITPAGTEAFRAYVDQLSTLLEGTSSASSDERDSGGVPPDGSYRA